jgi:hypothetical protein
MFTLALLRKGHTVEYDEAISGHTHLLAVFLK